MLITGAKDGNVMYVSQDGSRHGAFNLADWAVQTGNKVEEIDGFNRPVTALDVPPVGMTPLDQSVFYQSGKNVSALRGIFKEVKELTDGRVVVLDQDGIWRTMWSNNWQAAEPWPSYEERAGMGQAVNIKQAMRAAGVAFALGLAGVEPKLTKKGELAPKEVAKMMEFFQRNLPLEGQQVLSTVIEQTTGIRSWKFMAAMINPEELGDWLTIFSKSTSFSARQRQSALVDLIVETLHRTASSEFIAAIEELDEHPITKKFLINLGEAVTEFLQVLSAMDCIRDMSKITGLDEWKKMAKDDLVKEENLPPMPDFVPHLVKLLYWCMPLAENKNLHIARGKRGMVATVTLMNLADDALYSLKDVPDSAAKTKMFMALKTLQTQVENKLSYLYQPYEDKTGMEVNAFMAVKAKYAEKRELIYKLIQVARENWMRDILATLKEQPNLPAFFDTLPKDLSRMLQALLSSDVAYDMQPWIDTGYQERLQDPFAMFTDDFGAPPPESGYLADNSPRAAINIINTLTAAAGMLLATPAAQRIQIVRSPVLLSKFLSNMQKASVAQEVGVVEVLSRSGIYHEEDPYSSPDPKRIWEDPVKVQTEIDEQVQMVMRQIEAQQQAMMAQEQQEAQRAQAQQQAMNQPPQKGQGDGGGAQAPQQPQGPGGQAANMMPKVG